MLAARDLSFQYAPGRPILWNVSVTLEPGRITAIIGPNGAGKTTLLRVLLGLLKPATGSVALDGADVMELSTLERAARIAYVPQRMELAFGFDVASVVRFGCLSAARPRREEAARRALERVGLAARARDPLSSLSAGQQQRAALARALAQIENSAGARALLADEPVSAMDPRHAHLAMRTLADLADRGLAVAVVLHDFALAARYARDAVVLDEGGSVAARGPFREACTPEILERVFKVRFERAVTSSGGEAILVPGPAGADTIAHDG